VSGVLSNIICLFSDTKISEALNMLTRRVYDVVKKTHPEIQICNPSTRQKKRPKLAISDIENRIDLIMHRQGWTWDKILADAKRTCSTSLKSDGAYDVNLHPKKIAKHFQVQLIYYQCEN
jgi:hypothetical protein